MSPGQRTMLHASERKLVQGTALVSSRVRTICFEPTDLLTRFRTHIGLIKPCLALREVSQCFPVNISQVEQVSFKPRLSVSGVRVLFLRTSHFQTAAAE